MERYNNNATTINDAKIYMFARAKQLNILFYKLQNIIEYDWGIIAYFEKNNEIFQSIYILMQFRNKGIYRNFITNKILTSYDCYLEKYLNKFKIPYVIENLVPYDEYAVILHYYGSKKTKRSNKYLMNHIDEGLFILEYINASEIAKKSYCLHPIYQSDEDLLNNYKKYDLFNNEVIITTMEYRYIANDYLSNRNINDISEIKLSIFKDVNDMLIADKIQNKKDFDLYHNGTHNRS